MTTEETISELSENITWNKSNIEAEKEHKAYYNNVMKNAKKSLKLMNETEEGINAPDGALMGRNGYHSKAMDTATEGLKMLIEETAGFISDCNVNIVTWKKEIKAVENALKSLKAL